jgi:Ca-activated chloride channel family protein
VPIVALESPSHQDEFVVVKHAENYHEASLETTGGDLNRDLVLAYHISRPRTGIDLVTSKGSGEDGYFLLTMTPGEELGQAQQGMDYVFVLDISGSMVNDSKLQLSRDSIDAFVRELGPEDRFELITFNVAPQTSRLKLPGAERLVWRFGRWICAFVRLESLTYGSVTFREAQ